MEERRSLEDKVAGIYIMIVKDFTNSQLLEFTRRLEAMGDNECGILHNFVKKIKR